MGVVSVTIVLKPVDWKAPGARVDGEGDRALGLSRLSMDKVRRSPQRRQKAWPGEWEGTRRGAQPRGWMREVFPEVEKS